MKTTDWYGLYSSGWGSDLVPEAYSHPAKVRPGLARKIYEHAIEEGWLEAGSIVLDPFGGIAGFALSAMKYGMHWIGVELEQKFVDLGQQNIDLWNETYGPHLPSWGSAVLLQGDSRDLAQVVAEAGAVVSSPPFQSSLSGGQGVAERSDWFKDRITKGGKVGQSVNADYGNSPGQLAALPEGDLAAAISSPPYAGSLQTETPEQTARKQARIASSKSLYDGRNLEKQSPGKAALGGGYGSHPGQLGQMRDGGFVAAVSSPPFENVEGSHSARKFADPEKSAQDRAQAYRTGAIKGHYASEEAILRSLTKANEQTYGNTAGNIGQESGDTFWSAAKTIVEQVYQVLRPGGHAIWVTKAFVRKGKRVDFPGQWRELCEACGFVTLHQHQAWLVEDRGAQYDLMGELHERKVERKSFFRRLAEKKGSPPIDYEVIICMEKPTCKF